MKMERHLEIRRGRFRRRRRMNVFKICAAVVVIAGILIAAVFLFRMKSLNIVTVSVEGNGAVSAGSITKTVEDSLAGNDLYFLPRHSALLYPKGEIQKKLLAAFPRLAAVALSLRSPSELRVQVVEQKPAALWCSGAGADSAPSSGAVGAGSGPSCYFLNADGFVFDRAPDFSGETFFIFFGAIETVSPVGTNYLTPVRFRNLSSFIGQIKTLGLTPRSLRALVGGDFSLSIAEGPEILFSDSGGGFTATLENFQAVLTEGGFSGATGPDIGAVEYFDLRFDNKVFYKLKGWKDAKQTTTISH